MALNDPWHLYFMAALYIIAGIMHFVRPKMYMRILPGYLPGHKFLVTFSGLAEIILGIALCFSITRGLALYAIIAMLIFFFTGPFSYVIRQKSVYGPSQVDVDMANTASIRIDVLGILVSKELM